MLLQLKPLFMGEVDTLPIDTQLDLSEVEFQGLYPFQEPVRVQGAAEVSAGVVILRLTAAFRFDGRCDRCMDSFSRPYQMPVEHILVTSLNNEENDDFVLLDNYQLKLDELVETDILLGLPSKNLCREECRGLCPMCGKNLNEGLCGCHSETTDPRLEILRQLIN